VGGLTREMEEEKAFSRRKYSRECRKRREEFCRQVDGPGEFPTSAMRGQMKSSSTRNQDRREKVRFDRGVLGMSAGMVCVGRGPSARRIWTRSTKDQGRSRDRCRKPGRCERKMDKQKGEGGIYVWRKRRAAARARLTRSRGR